MFLMEHFILQMFSDRVWEYLFNKFGYSYLMYRKYKVIKDWYFIAENCFNQPSRRLCRHPPLHREGKFVVCSVWYFIAEIWSNNLFKQSLSQLPLTALFTKESRCCGQVGVFHSTNLLLLYEKKTAVNDRRLKFYKNFINPVNYKSG